METPKEYTVIADEGITISTLVAKDETVLLTDSQAKDFLNASEIMITPDAPAPGTSDSSNDSSDVAPVDTDPVEDQSVDETVI